MNVDIAQVIVGAIKGIFAGASAAAIGYFKREYKDEPFDSTKFTKTVVVGAVTGGLGGALGIEPTKAEEYLAYPVVILGIDAVTKLVARRVVTPIYENLKRIFS